MIAEYATYVMAAILVAAFAFEIRTGRIPNWLTLLPLAMFAVVLVLSDDRSTLYWQIGVAAAIFVVGLGLFAVGAFGAGAVKLLAALALFLPLDKVFYTLLVFLAAFFVSAILIVQIRKWFGSEDSKWHVMAKAVIPLSLPIGVAGMLGLFVL